MGTVAGATYWKTYLGHTLDPLQYDEPYNGDFRDGYRTDCSEYTSELLEGRAAKVLVRELRSLVNDMPNLPPANAPCPPPKN